MNMANPSAFDTAPPATTALVGLGANLGERAATLARAVELLDQAEGVRVLRHSRWIETRPVGGPAGQPPFLNGAAVVETRLPPLELLAVLRDVERRLGRQRHERWGARTIDLDLLVMGEESRHSKPLELPHPRLPFRRFALLPAADIAAQMRVPTVGKTIGELLARLDEGLPIVEIAAADPHLARRVADEVAKGLQGLGLPVQRWDPPFAPLQDVRGDNREQILATAVAQARLWAEAPSMRPLVRDRWLICGDSPWLPYGIPWLEEFCATEVAVPSQRAMQEVFQASGGAPPRPRLSAFLSGNAAADSLAERAVARAAVGCQPSLRLAVSTADSTPAVLEIVAAVTGMLPLDWTPAG